MTKQTIRFISPLGTLDVLARNGKTGISIFARVKPTGMKAVIGSRRVFVATEEKQAQEAFDALVAQAAEKGWTRKTAGSGATASQFTEIPSPDALPVSVPLKAKAPKAEAPAPKLVAKGGKK